MPYSYYKGEPLGKLPACAICAGPGEGERRELHLGYGVSVWLCATHRGERFLTRNAGRDLVASLGAVWRAAGCDTKKRHRALVAHRERLREGGRARERPGSYAWPELRRLAERRFAGGARPQAVLRQLADERCGGGRLPSPRTLRRWCQERRWLTPKAWRRAPARAVRDTPARAAQQAAHPAAAGRRPAAGGARDGCHRPVAVRSRLPP